MKDITPLLNNYREAARHLWNTSFHFLSQKEDTWQLHETYAEIASHLFTSLVLGHLGIHDQQMVREDEVAREPLLFLKVVPTAMVPICINRTTPPSGYWDDPVRTVSIEEADLRFLNYFDWDVVGVRDLEYYLVRIVAFSKHTHLVGRNALLQVKYAKVMLDGTVTQPSNEE